MSVNPNYTWLNTQQQEEDPDSILNFYRKAINLRKQLSCVRHGKYQEYQKLSDKLYMYSMDDGKQKILVICSFHDKDMKYTVPSGFDMGTGKLILCNYSNPLTNTLHPYECKVYLWK